LIAAAKSPLISIVTTSSPAGAPLTGLVSFNIYWLIYTNAMITNSPGSQAVQVGQPATLNVTAAGTPPVTYQWQFNGTLIPSATNSFYTISSVQLSNTGPYTVVVGNLGGSVTSSVAVLSLATNTGWVSPLSGKWETGTNWSLTVPPTFAESALITNAGAKTVTIDAATAGAFPSTMTVTNLTLANPATATWTAITTNAAPAPRTDHTAVWTGSEMLVWGGGSTSGNASDAVNSGGRYNPTSNAWTAISTNGAPTPRENHTAVWTGSEMLIWGGLGAAGYLNDGARYNPATDTWKSITNSGAPSIRGYHTAVWTGSEMLIWGGFAGGTNYLSSGARYNPASDSWTVIALNPFLSGRYLHTAVWSGSQMIIWGGYNPYNPSVSLNDGSLYNPTYDIWTPVTTTGAPAARYEHTAVWTGTRMIIWGGINFNTGLLNSGGGYDPAAGRWTATTVLGAPVPRSSHTAVWTGSAMVVWGGSPAPSFLNDGGQYSPWLDSWIPVSTAGAPSARELHTAVWTGGEMLIWGGNRSTVITDGGGYSGGAGNVLDLTSGNTNPPLHVLNNTLLQKGGTLTVDGNSLLQVDGQTTIGDAGFPGAAGMGLLAVNSGTATLANTVLGNAANSYGAIGLNGGTLQISGNLLLAAQISSTGLVSMTSGLLVNTNGAEIIGTNGNGSITQTGGTNQAATLNLGGAAGSFGSYTISNATLSTTTLNLGSSAGGLATLTVQSNSIVNIGANIVLTSGSLAATSSIALSGGTFTATNGLIQVGPVGRGQIVISGGNHTVRQLKLGSTNGVGAGALIISGGSLRVLGTGIGPGAGLVANFVLGLGGDWNADGTSITIGGDSHDATANLYAGSAECAAFYVGSGTNDTGTYLQYGGTLTVTNMMILGDCATNTVGAVTLSGGTAYVTNATHTAVLDMRNGTFTLGSGATLMVDNLVITNPCGQFIKSGGTLQAANLVLSPSLDADGDGQSNMAELLAGTDPFDPTSTFSILSVVATNSAGLPQTNLNDLRIDWTSVGGHDYVIQTNGVLNNSTFHDLTPVLANAGPAGIPGTNSYVVIGGATNAGRFYRVRLALHGYDPASGFSASVNPSGPWTYGYSTAPGATLTPYTNATTVNNINFWITNPSFEPMVYHNPTSTTQTYSTAQYGPNSFGLHPGPAGQFSITRFTVSIPGWYRLTGNFFGQDPNGTTTDVHIFQGNGTAIGTSIFDGQVNGFGPGTGPAFDLAVSLNAGDHVDFVVGYGLDGNYSSDSTGLSVEITGP
jgi:N-acetylneuraminic acid mutarotase